ncbi:MAG TPA: hypothetical protein DCL34_10335 [Erythrobacter sp.]|jgi:hypothetical protein|nr:hypothetical protein [Sphingomonas sp.]QPL39086.1 hypothetical protein IT881_13530 [Erythrobacter sp. A30-3]HAG37195.1 hypothetical protein [Erythrobacter sp.]|tara:strand:- start:412 stop:906 length:495 start_codon:yes stop_codon:yes gene_type:complete
MDLNELLHEHQVAVMRASAAGDDRSRDGHFARVTEYAERVRQMREGYAARDRPAQIAGQTIEGETIIYGTYTAPEEQPPAATPTVDSLEDEGGALDTPEPALPAGVTTSLVRNYHVGPHVYQDLNLAVAEHMRQLSQQAADGAGDPPVDDYGAGDPPVDDPARD